MNVSVTRKEFEAINFAIGQIESVMETSENPDWNDEAVQNLKLLYRVCEKIKESWKKADELNEVRRFVRSEDPSLNQGDLEKMARAVLRKSKRLANS